MHDANSLRRKKKIETSQPKKKQIRFPKIKIPPSGSKAKKTIGAKNYGFLESDNETALLSVNYQNLKNGAVDNFCLPAVANGITSTEDLPNLKAAEYTQQYFDSNLFGDGPIFTNPAPVTVSPSARVFNSENHGSKSADMASSNPSSVTIASATSPKNVVPFMKTEVDEVSAETDLIPKIEPVFEDLSTRDNSIIDSVFSEWEGSDDVCWKGTMPKPICHSNPEAILTKTDDKLSGNIPFAVNVSCSAY